MKLKFLLCDIHTHELEKLFGVDAMKAEVKTVRWLPAICHVRSRAEKLHSASFEVIFDAEKVIE